MPDIKSAWESLQSALARLRNAKPRHVSNNQVISDGKDFDLASRDVAIASAELMEARMSELAGAAKKYLEGATINARAANDNAKSSARAAWVAGGATAGLLIWEIGKAFLCPPHDNRTVLTAATTDQAGTLKSWKTPRKSK